MPTTPTQPAAFLPGLPVADGLYDPRFEHDNCGFGFVANVTGERSHLLVTRALEMLTNMEHRGGCGCDPGSGDGAGVLVGMPDAFLRRAAEEIKIELPPVGEFAVGMMFLPQDTVQRRKCERLFERVLADYDMHVIGWRDVPTDNSGLGHDARKVEPMVRQAFVGMKRSFFDRSDFNRRLYLVRQRVENAVEFGDGRDWPKTTKEQFYLCTLSTNRLVYKGMLTAPQLGTLLPGPAERGLRGALRHRPLAVQHQHLPKLATGPPVPLPGTQRRDQHDPGQPQLDACPIRQPDQRALRH